MNFGCRARYRSNFCIGRIHHKVVVETILEPSRLDIGVAHVECLVASESTACKQERDCKQFDRMLNHLYIDNNIFLYMKEFF